MPPAIVVENVSKRYRISHEAGGRLMYRTLREEIMRLAQVPWNWLTRKARPKIEDFWALKDVSFQVQPGDVVGVIGSNGAGKSTLLKILSRITPPTAGRIRMRGRVGSLLEVGTGFHSELTGRENIFLSGAILGMHRREIQRKFDEIVAFADILKFLDTPVKRYSSGMYMRLAFSVAAHLETELLLIDEVLAVGDAAFQTKCLGKMSDLAKGGRTVLFVSHNLAAIRSLASQSVLLSSGRAVAVGRTDDVIELYGNEIKSSTGALPIRTSDMGVHGFAVHQFGRPTVEIDGAQPFRVEIDYEIYRPLNGFRIGFYLMSPAVGILARTLTPDFDSSLESAEPGRYQATLELPGNFLAQGNYQLLLHASCYGILDYLHAYQLQIQMTVHPSSAFNAAHPTERFEGVILIGQPWSVLKKSQLSSVVKS